MTTKTAGASLGYVVVWVSDVDAALRFYETAFGLVRRSLQRHGDVDWGELETGATTLAFASRNEAERLFAEGFHPVDADTVPVGMIVSFIVADVEAAYASAVAAGASGRDAPRREPWGQVIARLRTPHGLVVSLASPRPDR